MQIDYVYNKDTLSCKEGRSAHFLDYSQYFSNDARSLLYTTNDSNNLKDVLTHETRSRLRTSFDIYKTVSPAELENGRDVLLCDFFDVLCFARTNINLSKYKRIIVFDCVELTKFLNRNIDVPIVSQFDAATKFTVHNFIRTYKNKLLFLVTDYNKRDVERLGVDCVLYYKKINFSCFNKSHIDSIARKNNLCMYINTDNKNVPSYIKYLKQIKTKYPEIVITHDCMDLWHYQNVLYTPKPIVGFVEQFGRLPFELKHFGYNVVEDMSFAYNNEKTGFDFYKDYYKNKSIDIKTDNLLNIISNSL